MKIPVVDEISAFSARLFSSLAVLHLLTWDLPYCVVVPCRERKRVHPKYLNLKHHGYRWMCVIVCLCCSTVVWADDFFADIETQQDEPATKSQLQKLDLSGWWQQKSAYSLQSQDNLFSRQDAGWSRLESAVQLQADYKVSEQARITVAGRLTHDWLPELHQANDDWFYQMSDSEVDDREWDWQLRDSYTQAQLGSLWVKGGYQTLAWGQLDSIQISDVLSTRDQRWPGQAELEDVRLPVPALKAELNNNDSRLTLIGIVAAGTDRTPSAYADFDPLIDLRSSDPDIDLDENDGFEWAMQYQQFLKNADTQLSVAQVYDNSPYPDAVEYGLVNGSPAITAIHLKQDRFSVVSFGGSVVEGKWLLKGETGVQADRKLQTDLDDGFQDWLEKDRWLGGIALERNINDFTITSELNAAHIFDYEDTLVAESWEYGGMLRVRWNGYNDQLALQSSVICMTGDNGWIFRQEASWDYSSMLTFGASLISYMADSDSQYLYAYRNSDVVVLDVRVNFL